ncbi:hypothetical protein Nepgr_016782 [Nepenthes gracilis]|uniref:RING-type E3 ubiquitin transferase n=1 Tax=Nepenthes gracilis TaxID=150966 RepID=A0AAD3XSN7_NEPGR|nr:hypothetical protein Nepgr_016782 [Nepenthes gracilis]
MAEDNLWTSGLSSGLALILNDENKKDISLKNRLISSYDDLGRQSLERTLEHIFDLPYKSIDPISTALSTTLVRSIIKQYFLKYHPNMCVCTGSRDGFSVTGKGLRTGIAIEESSICGDLRITKPPFLLESLTIFSSVRANACVWKGKWMYEVILVTAGIQQLGWATLSCPFTDRMGVGDAEDSYAFDGKRERKWNEKDEGYGQPWVVGDVIGCCIDLDEDRILFYRNGISLGVAFGSVRKMGPGKGYFPAISLSHGEKCDLNFGSRPFKYPIAGFFPLQGPPSANALASWLLQCLLRLMEVQRMENSEFTSVGKLGRLKRFVSLEDIFHPVALAICEEFFGILELDVGSMEYIAWGPLLSFLMEVYGLQAPHDHRSLDKVLDLFLKFRSSSMLFQQVIGALSCGCRTASLVLTDSPYSGSYSYLALACHLLRREELMVLWWKSSEFEFMFEGFLSRKSPNKHDLQFMIPSVWRPNSYEDVSHESSMMLTTTALSGAISKIEEKHRDLCHLVIQFIPPVTPRQLPGSVFRTFLHNLLLKNRGADRSTPSPGVLSNPVLVSMYTVILHFLSEGFPLGDICGWPMGCRGDGKTDVGFLHRGGLQSFPIGLFLKNDPHRVDISRLGGSFSHLSKTQAIHDQEVEVISWEEGCVDNEESRVTHSTRQKPCCCSSYEIDFTNIYSDPIRVSSKGSRGHNTPIPERSAHVAAECSAGSLNDEISDKPSSSDHSHSQFEYRPVQHMRTVTGDSSFSSATLREEELLDAMLLLYHMGVSPDFKQASYYMSHQTQSMALLEETDKQIREGACIEQQKRLKEARNIYREEVIDCVRHSTWYRISLLSRWKQRGMYAGCMWTVQLLLVLSKEDPLFSFVPEFYVESLVDCFHVLRKSDPPFVPSSRFIKQGLTSFVTFVVTHFNDPRISSADLRDLLLQSISVLVQYKEFLTAFEINEAATCIMPKALLSAFDNRSWIPVTNILLRLCKGSGFGSSKHGESSSSTLIFQRLFRDVCVKDEELFAAFLNRLFNTLSWTMTEFSVSIREMHEKSQVSEFQQRKCGVIFDLSCNLARILEFYTHEIPQAFLLGTDMNLRRLTELVVFILNQMNSATDSDFFELSIRRHGCSLEKVNRGLILAPLVGILVNLLDASVATEQIEQNDVAGVFASMDCPDAVLCGLQCMLEYNWVGFSKGNVHCAKLRQLEEFSSLLIKQMGSRESERAGAGKELDSDDETCCICYICEADVHFVPCLHKSCFGCITRHLLNCQRCFFCNATVIEVVRDIERSA